MQTFLPSRSFSLSAKLLDNKRLGKQRVECKQILKALKGEYNKTGAWVNHPATRMWRGYEFSLCNYAIFVCQEWQHRGFKDSLLDYFIENIRTFSSTVKIGDIQCLHRPPWLSNEALFSSHRSNLLRKDHEFYSKYHWKEPDNLPYVWPV